MNALNITASTEVAAADAGPPPAPKPARVSTKVERADMTAAIAGEWLEVRTDVFTPEEHGVAATITQKNLYWKKPVLGRPAGSFAGQRRPVDDYYSVVLLGNSYSGTRLIGLLETGEWPAERARAEGGVVKQRAALAVRSAPVPLTAEQKAAMRAELKAKYEAKKAGTAAPVAAPAVETAESVEQLASM